MLYERRIRLVQQLLKKAAVNGESIILFGSGVWFTAAERMLSREIPRYNNRVNLMQLHPVFRATFLSNGCIQCVNLETGDNLHLIAEGRAHSPDKAYLVEDVPGDNAEVWNDIIKPFLLEGDTQVVYLGNGQDEFFRKN